MPGFVVKSVLPGDALDIEESASSETVICGNGLEEVVLGPKWSEEGQEGHPHPPSQIVVTRPGELKNTSNRYWISSVAEARFRPVKGDALVGAIVSKGVDYYKVDIGSPQNVLLPVLAFEGASRRNRPSLKIGSLVHCKVVSDPSDTEMIVECFDSTTGKAEGLGELKGGYCLALPDLRPEDEKLGVIGELLPFEIAVGKNGQSWIKASSSVNTAILMNALEKMKENDAKQLREMIRKMLSNT